MCTRVSLCLAHFGVKHRRGWRSELSTRFGLCCVNCLCWVNQLPSARVKVFVKVKGPQQQQRVFDETRCCVRLLSLLRQRHKDARADTHKASRGLVWRVQAEVTAGRLPLMQYSCLIYCLLCLISISNWPPPHTRSDLYFHLTHTHILLFFSYLCHSSLFVFSFADPYMWGEKLHRRLFTELSSRHLPPLPTKSIFPYIHASLHLSCSPASSSPSATSWAGCVGVEVVIVGEGKEQRGFGGVAGDEWGRLNVRHVPGRMRRLLIHQPPNPLF